MKYIFYTLLLPLLLFAREWTTLVYMIADNDLAQWADSDLVEMEAIGSSEESAVIVQLDKPYIGASRLYVNQGYSYEIQDLGIMDMCDWQELADFIIWGMTQYPAKKYNLILWDHGSGWTMSPRGSFGNDWSGGSQMSIAGGDFRKAIHTACNYTGNIIDLLAFDACLMQQLEVAYEIRATADVFLAPEIICPVQGFRYDSILATLNAQPSMDESALARHIIDITVRYFTDRLPVVLSAVDLHRVDAFGDDLDELADALIAAAPDAEFKNLRQIVQTIPPSGYATAPEHDIVDLGDMLEKLHERADCPESQQVIETYHTMLLYSRWWGDDFDQTTGLAVWFPDVYPQFKQGIQRYSSLLWAQSRWLNFLNWFYGEDDIRPTPVSLKTGAVGDCNDFRLSWSASHDLAPLHYQVIEARDTVVIFSDMCEDSAQWELAGFSLSSNNVHSGAFSFFSGDGSNLQHFMETRTPLLIEEYGLLSLYLHVTTEDMVDSLIIQYGNYLDVHYGFASDWQERRIFLPAGNGPIRISYHTNETVNRGGCYIDDIRLYHLTAGRTVRAALADTILDIFNHERGSYLYAVQPVDQYGNRTNVSNITLTVLDQYATPFSRPNPFQTNCVVVLDYPDSLSPTIDIFSIAGRKIRSFSSDMIHDHTISWDAKDEHGEEIGAGLYFVVIHDDSFIRIGKIARQR